MLVVALVAYLGVSSAASPVKLSRASADVRFSVDSNAAGSQYCADTSGDCTTTTSTTTTTTPVDSGVGSTPPIVTGTTTTGTSTTGTGTKTTGTGTKTTGTGTKTTGTGTGTKTTGTGSKTTGTSGKGSSPSSGTSPSGTGSSGATVGNGAGATTASAAYCGEPVTTASVQTSGGFSFADGVSGDIGLFGDDGGSDNGVSAAGGLASANANQHDRYSGGETVFNNSTAAGGSGFNWNTGMSSQYVSYCDFWPVDPWGRWGFELYCNQSNPCHDTASATSEDPSDDKTAQVTGQQSFTLPAHQIGLVNLTLNHLGERLLTQSDGQLTGTIHVSSDSGAVAGQRNFHIYYVRCIVWGSAKPVSDSIEAQFSGSSIGKAYKTRGLSALSGVNQGCS